MSIDAFDMMQKLLVEKEHRLCTRRYELNDYTHKFIGVRFLARSGTIADQTSQTGTKIFPADKNNRNYNGFFVYPDDADDIKKHSFFHGIPWDNMQEYNPPFVPRVQSWDDTKYFDDEGPISDIDSATSDDSVQAVRLETPALDPDCHQQEPQLIVPENPQTELEKNAGSPVSPTVFKAKKPREKKRPRDKILRDPNCGKVALEMRKNSGFIGYGYRKPKGISEVIEEALENEEAKGSLRSSSEADQVS